VGKVTNWFRPEKDKLFVDVYRDIGRRAQIPDWFYFTPFGQPRGIDVTNIRSLASQPWIEACVSTLTDSQRQGKFL